MALRRSSRNLLRDQSLAGDVTPSRPKRGPLGFRKFKNGLLDLTPVTEEEQALCDLNATESELLNLPAEIRAMIWGFVVGGNELHLSRDKNPLMAAHFKRDYFPLLRVCRQVYSEAALLPYTQNLFCFEGSVSWFEYTSNTLLKNVHSVRVRMKTCTSKMVKVPPATLRNLRTVHLELYVCNCYMRMRAAPSNSTIRAYYENVFASQRFSLEWIQVLYCGRPLRRVHR